MKHQIGGPYVFTRPANCGPQPGATGAHVDVAHQCVPIAYRYLRPNSSLAKLRTGRHGKNHPVNQLGSLSSIVDIYTSPQPSTVSAKSAAGISDAYTHAWRSKILCFR